MVPFAGAPTPARWRTKSSPATLNVAVSANEPGASGVNVNVKTQWSPCGTVAPVHVSLIANCEVGGSPPTTVSGPIGPTP